MAQKTKVKEKLIIIFSYSFGYYRLDNFINNRALWLIGLETGKLKVMVLVPGILLHGNMAKDEENMEYGVCVCVCAHAGINPTHSLRQSPCDLIAF